jgi:hypothetical protein
MKGEKGERKGGEGEKKGDCVPEPPRHSPPAVPW